MLNLKTTRKNKFIPRYCRKR